MREIVEIKKDKYSIIAEIDEDIGKGCSGYRPGIDFLGFLVGKKIYTNYIYTFNETFKNYVSKNGYEAITNIEEIYKAKIDKIIENKMKNMNKDDFKEIYRTVKELYIKDKGYTVVDVSIPFTISLIENEKIFNYERNYRNYRNDRAVYKSNCMWGSEIMFDIVNDKFTKSDKEIFDLCCTYQEQMMWLYENMGDNAPAAYRFMKDYYKFLDDKKTIKLVLNDGTEIPVETKSLWISHDNELNYGTNKIDFKINFRGVKKVERDEALIKDVKCLKYGKQVFEIKQEIFENIEIIVKEI